MDKVQIYTTVMLSIRAFVFVYGLGKHGFEETKTRTYSHPMEILANTIIHLPLLGRVLGWW